MIHSRRTTGLSLRDTAASDALLADAQTGTEPWATVAQAQYRTNIVFGKMNAPAGTDEAKRTYAVQQAQNNTPLAWSDAVNLYNAYVNTYQAQGQYLQFKTDPDGTAAIIDGIVSSSGLENDIVWAFFQLLYFSAIERGQVQVIGVADMPSPIADAPQTGSALPWVALGVGIALATRKKKR